MPKVIHVLRKFEPAEWGGIETHLLGLIPWLDRLGWSSEVHAPAEAGTDGAPLVAAGGSFRTFRAHYPCLGMGPRERSELVAIGGNLISFDELARLMMQRRASMLHVHTVRRLGGVVRVASKVTGVPYAVTIHSPIRAGAEMAEREAASRRQRMIDVGAPFGWAVGARRVVEDADAVFALNNAEYSAWKDDRAGRHLELLSLGVDPVRATVAARADVRRLIPQLGDTPFIVCVGRLDTVKGQDVAIEAFRRAAPAGMHLVLAGAPVNRQFGERLRNQAAPLGDRVHFLGNVPPSQARALLAESQLALMPARAEPFGLVLLEAWAEGTAALYADVGGFGDMSRSVDAPFGLVAGHDPETWAQRIRAALADTAGVARERREGPERVARHFSWEAVARRIVDVYGRCTEQAQVG